MRPLNRRERSLAVILAGVALVAGATVGTIQVIGGPIGAPCADSYSCRGFLIGGAECLEVDDGAYCTLYCDGDADCPDGWSCAEANPTALRIETSAVDEVCLRGR